MIGNTKEQNDYYFSSGKYISVKSLSEKFIKNKCNILVIPDHLENQWVKFIELSPLLFHIYKNDDIINDNIDICLLKSKNFDYFMDNNKNVSWNRIIIDEADSIKINDYYLHANFIWLITGTPSGLINSKKKYLKNIFKDNINWIVPTITIKNNNDYVKKSLVLPSINRYIIKCLTPMELNIIGEFIPSSVKQMINAGNIDEAIRLLNCNVDTKDNIFIVITKSIENMIYNRNIEIENEKNKKYNGIRLEQSKLEIKKLELSKKKLESRLSAIKTKIKESDENLCPICLGEVEKETLVDCCGTIFCFDCFAMTNKTNKCPYCQQKISKKSIHIIQSKKEKVNNYQYLEKMDNLLNIIMKKEDGKILLFANYNESFNKIKNVLELNKISYGILYNDKNTNKLINDFENGKIKILMLNALHFGAGLNLQCATDIIIYHRFTKEIEEQVIGRAQRIGRKDKLNVYYLIHENEEKCFTEMFDSVDYEKYLNDN